MWRTGSGYSRELEPLGVRATKGLDFLGGIALHTASRSSKGSGALNLHGGMAVSGVLASWIPKGLWTVVPNSGRMAGGLHPETGTGNCVTAGNPKGCLIFALRGTWWSRLHSQLLWGDGPTKVRGGGKRDVVAFGGSQRPGTKPSGCGKARACTSELLLQVSMDSGPGNRPAL